MEISRRYLLSILAGGIAGPRIMPLQESINRYSYSPLDVYPHNTRPVPKTFSNKKIVFGFWHFFPLSFDNKICSNDYYTQGFIDPEGENGKHRDYGGFIKDRPMPQGPIHRDDWRTESAYHDILYAQQSGVNSFLFNVSSLDNSSGYLHNANALYLAIEKFGLPFRLAPCLDLSTLSLEHSVNEIRDYFLPMLKRKGTLTMPDGRPLLAAFSADSWPPTRWNEILKTLENAGVRVCFLPIFLDGKRTTEAHLNLADIIGWWSGNFPESAIRMRDKANSARRRGKAFMWSVWPQDCRPKGQWYAEARNSETFRLGWQAAIDFDPEFVCVNTWNDYSESSQLRPSIGTQYSFSDLNRFYCDWYQSGSPPKIMRDVIFYFHRQDFTGQAHGLIKMRPPMQNHLGPPSVDEIEVVCFLLSKSIIEINNAKGIYKFNAKPGISTFRAPLSAGIQHIRLIRNGDVLRSFSSPFSVREKWYWQDLSYKGGSSARTPLIYDPSTCKLL